MDLFQLNAYGGKLEYTVMFTLPSEGESAGIVTEDIVLSVSETLYTDTFLAVAVKGSQMIVTVTIAVENEFYKRTYYY